MLKLKLKHLHLTLLKKTSTLKLDQFILKYPNFPFQWYK